MRCLFTLIITLLGLASLAASGYLLYTSFIDTPDVRTDTLGGASQTQHEVSAANTDANEQLDLSVVVDGQRTSTNSINSVPIFDQSEVTEIVTSPERNESVADQDQELIDELSVERVNQAQEVAGVSTVLENELLSNDTQVAVRPLNSSTITTNEDGGRGEVDGQGGGGSGAGIEQRVVEFEWPAEFRTGEAGSIRLTLKALPSGGLEASVAEIPTNAVIATPILMTDCYEEYTATVSARIIAPAFEIESTTNDAQPLSRGEEVTWRWSLTPDKEGTFIITMAINLSWQLKPTVTEPQSPLCLQLSGAPFSLWGQSVQVEVSKVLGLITIQQASIAGTVLAVVGFIAELPFMGEIFGVLFERRLERRADRKRQRQAAKSANRRRR